MAARRRAKSASLGRASRGLPPRPRLLIVCEGSHTEPGYLQALCRQLRLDRSTAVIQAAGAGPTAVVRHAKRHRLRDDQVWCVFDRDQHEDYATAYAQAGKLGFRCAVSNPCFEFWLVLHYEYTSAPLSTAGAFARLRTHLAGYDTAGPVYASCGAQLKVALHHARVLRQHHDDVGNQPDANPSTTVPDLVIVLQDRRDQPPRDT
ncbi:MAG: RloB domain-containing protein [Fimbriimonadaceae bacterium]|nr:RloB domain-containing protein [Fimbriimonadaceae bacterium]